jgi:hypothetical protein
MAAAGDDLTASAQVMRRTDAPPADPLATNELPEVDRARVVTIGEVGCSIPAVIGVGSVARDRA